GPAGSGRPRGGLPGAVGSGGGPRQRVACQVPESAVQPAPDPCPTTHVPAMSGPVQVPVYETASAPFTKPKVMSVPDNVPVIDADEMQGVPAISIVPLSVDPLCWKFSVNVPVSPTYLVLDQVPFHVPVMLPVAAGPAVEPAVVGV